MRVGRTRIRLAKLLNKTFTHRGAVKLLWLPEKLYAAQGYYRTDPYVDCGRWEGFAVNADKPEQTIAGIQSYSTMTECLKAGAVHMGTDGTVYAGE